MQQRTLKTGLRLDWSFIFTLYTSLAEGPCLRGKGLRAKTQNTDVNAKRRVAGIHKSQEAITVHFVNASVLPRTSSLKLETLVLERRVLDCKRKLYASRHAF